MPIKFVLCTEIEMMSIQKEENMKKYKRKIKLTTMKLVLNLMLTLQGLQYLCGNIITLKPYLLLMMS